MQRELIWASAIALGLVLVMVVFGVQSRYGNSNPPDDSPPATDSSQILVAPSPTHTTQTTPLSIPTTASTESTAMDNPPTVLQLMPSVQAFRDEAAKDVHETPPVFMRFADTVGLRFDAVKNDPKMAQQLFSELKECALNNSTVSNLVTVRGFCARIAQMLASTRPELAPQFIALTKALPPEVQKLIAPLKVRK